jgi:GNAT superfamily N-acetyltransferase
VKEAGSAEASFWAAFLRNRNVDAGTANDGAIAVAGGYALCVPGTLLTLTIGAGEARPLRDEDCSAVEDFFAERSLPARFELETGVLERDGPLLRARGYRDEGTTLTVLTGATGVHGASASAAVRPTTDRRQWSELFVRAADDGRVHGDLLRRSALLNAAAAHTLVVASLDGQDVGVAATGIYQETAFLYSAAVLPPFRSRGVHGALIAARLEIAHGRGAAKALLKTTPDSPGERAARKAGLVPTAVRRRVRRELATFGDSEAAAS